MRFFKQVPRSFTLFAVGDEQPAMDEPDKQDTRAAITLFRQIYTPSEPTSSAVVLNLLKRSAHEHDGPLRDAAITELKDLQAWSQETLDRGIGIGIVFDHGHAQERVSPEEILDAYFHGLYLHSGNDLRTTVERLEGIDPVPAFTLYNVMWDLCRVYYVVANVVDRVLGEPDLLDRGSDTAVRSKAS